MQINPSCRVNTDATWRALGDPTRRALLDHLRAGPKTTGALCAAVPMLGRTSVMKHLDVLVAAGLVLVRRQGRHRFNHLNPVPIVAIHERWIAPHIGQRASALLRLGRRAEARTEARSHPTPETTMPPTPDATDTTDATPDTARTERIELALDINADRTTVWRALIDDIGQWWPAAYRGTTPAGTFHFEAHPGGRVWEETPGGGLQWYQVQALEAEQWVSLVGFIAPPWGGPSVSLLRIELADGDDSTIRLRVTDAGVGRLPDHETVATGWETIFGGLKAHLEGAD